MRIIVRYFEDPFRPQWERMATVLRHTIQQHCQNWIADVQRFDPPPIGASPLGLNPNVTNTQKLDQWTADVQELSDGDRVLLLDADTAILKPIDDVWDNPFDVALTYKPQGSRYPLNGGVVFLRVSPRTKNFMLAWMLENTKFFQDPLEHQVWRPAFGGMNQSALGALLIKKRTEGLCIRRLPCLEWNCEDESWEGYDPAVTRILHLKTDLRVATLSGQPRGEYRTLGRLWLSLESQTREAQRVAS